MTQDTHTSQPGIALADADISLQKRARTPQPGQASKTERAYVGRVAYHKRRAIASASFGAITFFASLAVKPGVLTAVALICAVIYWHAAVDQAATYIYKNIPEPAVVSKIDARTDCARYVAVLGSGDRVLGFLPQSGDCGDRAHAYLPVSNAAMLRHASFIETVEGPFDGPGVVLNMSAEGLARAFYYTLFRSETVGGTLPVLSAIEFVAGHSAALGPADKAKFFAFWGPTFIAHYLPEIEDRKRFATEQLPCARPMPGTDAKVLVFSGGFCGLLVGPTPSLVNLTDAQHCLIVAAYKHQLPLVGPAGGAEHHAEISAAFDTLKTRADRTCLSRRLAGSQLDQARAELAAIPLPVSADIIAKFRGLTTTARGAATLIRDARVRLQDSGSSDEHLAVTLDQAATARMTRALRQSVDREMSTLLSPELCWGAGCPFEDHPHVALAVATLSPEGLLEFDAAYQSRSGLLLPRSESWRNTASTSKAMLLPFLLEHGLEHVCIDAQNWPRRLGLPADSGTCGFGLLPLPLEDAVAVSNNAAFLAALSHPRIDEAELLRYMRLLGYRIKDGLSGDALHKGIVFGWDIGIDPDALMRNMAFLASQQPVTLPQLFQGETRADFTFGAFVGARALERAKEMLQAPLQANHGTLSGVSNALERVGCGASAIAKSGTADADNNLARDRLSVGAFTCDDGTIRVFFSLIGSPSHKQELGRDITSKTTNRIVGSALTAYAQEISK